MDRRGGAAPTARRWVLRSGSAGALCRAPASVSPRGGVSTGPHAPAPPRAGHSPILTTARVPTEAVGQGKPREGGRGCRTSSGEDARHAGQVRAVPTRAGTWGPVSGPRFPIGPSLWEAAARGGHGPSPGPPSSPAACPAPSFCCPYVVNCPGGGRPVGGASRCEHHLSSPPWATHTLSACTLTPAARGSATPEQTPVSDCFSLPGAVWACMRVLTTTAWQMVSRFPRRLLGEAAPQQPR